MPILNVSIIYKHTESKRFEAVVDSGAPTCLFHGSIGKVLGMKIETGEEGPLGGVVANVKTKVYYHPIKLKVNGQMISIARAGFSNDLGVLAILGREGFFDNYVVTFDPCNNPPGLIMERFHRT